MTEGEHIVELLSHWVTFSKSYDGGDVKSFSQWLYHQKNNDSPEPTTEEGSKGFDEVFEERVRLEEGETGAIDLEMSIGVLWGRLIRFTHLLTKRTFKDVPIRSFEDFGILRYVQYLKSPTKSELVELSLLEASTCFEVIKRLIKLELLTEKVDDNDKRSRRVELTTKGQQLIDQLMPAIDLTAKLTVGDLSKEEKLLTVQIFRKLDAFHSKIHKDHPEESLEELKKLIEE
ncbi:MAG: winged helix DNA-binding protein [Bacteroidota bacterium]